MVIEGIIGACDQAVRAHQALAETAWTAIDGWGTHGDAWLVAFLRELDGLQGAAVVVTMLSECVETDGARARLVRLVQGATVIEAMRMQRDGECALPKADG